MSNEIESYGEWLNTELKLIETYQNHKETMAWTATALFLGGGGAFVSSVPEFATANQCLVTLLIILAVVAFFFFLRMQFRKRWDGADIQEGIRFALARLYLSSGADELNREPSKEKLLDGLPRFVTDAIAEVQGRKKRQIRRYKDLRWHSEWSSYILVILATATMLYALWTAPTSGALKMNELVKGITLLSRQADQEAAQLRDQIATTNLRLEKRLEKIENLLMALSPPMTQQSDKTKAGQK